MKEKYSWLEIIYFYQYIDCGNVGDNILCDFWAMSGKCGLISDKGFDYFKECKMSCRACSDTSPPG